MNPQTCDLSSEQAPAQPLVFRLRALNVAGSPLLRCLFQQWEPDRPELLIRLRPRTEESRVPR